MLRYTVKFPKLVGSATCHLDMGIENAGSFVIAQVAAWGSVGGRHFEPKLLWARGRWAKMAQYGRREMAQYCQIIEPNMAQDGKMASKMAQDAKMTQDGLRRWPIEASKMAQDASTWPIAFQDSSNLMQTSKTDL